MLLCREQSRPPSIGFCIQPVCATPKGGSRAQDTCCHSAVVQMPTWPLASWKNEAWGAVLVCCSSCSQGNLLSRNNAEPMGWQRL